MQIELGRDEVVETVVMGAATVAWYAMPDVIRSRSVRGALKGTFGAGDLVYAIPRARAEVAERATEPLSAEAARIRELTGATPVLDETLLDLDDGDLDKAPRWAIVAGAGLGVVALAGVVAGSAAVESAIFRLGERGRARGRWAPHTRIGLVACLASTAATLAAVALEQSSTRRT